MKLPKRELPRYTVTLPYSGKQTQIRPYTVKEEKILMMAAQSKDPQTVEDAMRQVIENCTDCVYGELSNADFEYLYVKLVSVSVSNVSAIRINMDCGKPECPREHETAVNLDHIKLKGVEGVSQSGAYKKNDYWVIEFDENSGVCLRLRMTKDTIEDTLMACTVSVYDSEGVYDDFTKEELVDYYECLRPEEFAKVSQFINVQPYCSIEVDGKCRQCGKVLHVETKGVLDFLE